MTHDSRAPIDPHDPNRRLSTAERDALVILRDAHRRLDLMGFPYAPPRTITGCPQAEERSI